MSQPRDCRQRSAGRPARGSVVEGPSRQLQGTIPDRRGSCAGDRSWWRRRRAYRDKAAQWRDGPSPSRTDNCAAAALVTSVMPVLSERVVRRGDLKQALETDRVRCGRQGMRREHSCSQPVVGADGLLAAGQDSAARVESKGAHAGAANGDRNCPRRSGCWKRSTVARQR